MSFKARPRLALFAHVVWCRVVVLCQSTQSRYQARKYAFRVSLPVRNPVRLIRLALCCHPHMPASTAHGRILVRFCLDAISLPDPQNVITPDQDLAEGP